MSVHELQAFLDQYEIEHFAATELLSRVARGGPRVVVPPAVLWPNAIPTLRCADEIRRRLGAPITVSWYRTDAYNQIVRGSPTSEHKEFRAGDLFADDLAELRRVAAEVMDEADAEGLATGLAYYDRFIHIDVGATKRWHRRWRRDFRS